MRPLRHDVNFVRWAPSIVACAITAVLLEDEGLHPEGVITRLASVVSGVDPAQVRGCAAEIDAFRNALSNTHMQQ